MVTELALFEKLAGLGVGGLFAAVFLIMYLRKDKECREKDKECHEQVDKFLASIEKITKSQVAIRIVLEGIKTVLLQQKG